MLTNLKVKRATSYMSRGSWPCSGEGPWLSSKGHTMGVGIAILCSHRSSSIGWSENGPCCGIIANFIGRKGGTTLPHLLHVFISSLFLWLFFLHRWGKKEGHDGSSWEKREDFCCICFILVFAHDCATMCLICKHWHSMQNQRMPWFLTFALRVRIWAMVMCGHLREM